MPTPAGGESSSRASTGGGGRRPPTGILVVTVCSIGPEAATLPSFSTRAWVRQGGSPRGARSRARWGVGWRRSPIGEVDEELFVRRRRGRRSPSKGRSGVVHRRAARSTRCRSPAESVGAGGRPGCCTEASSNRIRGRWSSSCNDATRRQRGEPRGSSRLRGRHAGLRRAASAGDENAIRDGAGARRTDRGARPRRRRCRSWGVGRARHPQERRRALSVGTENDRLLVGSDLHVTRSRMRVVSTSSVDMRAEQARRLRAGGGVVAGVLIRRGRRPVETSNRGC